MKETLLLAIGLLAASAFADDRRPTRADCIVAYDLDWPASPRTRADVLNDFNVSPELAQRVALAGLATPTGKTVFLQFTTGCSGKAKKSQEIISEWSRIPGAPRFVLRKESVKPEPGTVDIRGPHWRE